MYASLGKVATLGIAAVTNQAILGIVPSRQVRSAYLCYWLEHMQIHIGQLSSSNTQDNLNAFKVRNMPLYLPSTDEQQSVVSVLDRETAKIDALVEKKRRLLGLIEEKRAALISHAVTRGLNPTVPMKDSGIEWVEQVPVHWQVKRLKHLVTEIVDAEHKTATYEPNGTYLVVRTSNVRNGMLVLDDARYTDEAGFSQWTQRGVPKPGDILFTREAPSGEACLVPSGVRLCLGQRMVLLRT